MRGIERTGGWIITEVSPHRPEGNHGAASSRIPRRRKDFSETELTVHRSCQRELAVHRSCQNWLCTDPVRETWLCTDPVEES